jgi:hypothetical protein
MGYKLIQQSNMVAHDVYELVVDTPEDLEKLPDYIGAGSTVMILKGAGGALEVRVKAPSGDWMVV